MHNETHGEFKQQQQQRRVIQLAQDSKGMPLFFEMASHGTSLPGRGGWNLSCWRSMWRQFQGARASPSGMSPHCWKSQDKVSGVGQVQGCCLCWDSSSSDAYSVRLCSIGV